MKKLMYAMGDQQVWLIWELKNGRATLACICTTDEDLKRYVADDRKTWHGRPDPVFCEKVVCDHLYGGNDMAIASRIMRQS